MRYLVYGAGAVGSLLGTRLALCGNDVHFLARPRFEKDFRRYGLHITGDTNPVDLKSPDVTTSLNSALSRFDPEVILLTVKAFDIQDAASDIQDQLPSEVPVVCFANGINNEETLGQVLGPNRVIPATITTAVQLFPEGIIRVERQRGVGLAGSHPLISHLDKEFASSGMVVRNYPNPNRMKWSKALTNIVSNASSAILGWTPAQIFQHSGLCRLELEALREVVRVMGRMGMRPQNLPGVPLSLLGFGIFLPFWITQKALGRIVAKGRGEKRPSFHYDIGRGRSEVKWLNGAIALSGRQHDVPTPANEVLYELMMSLVDDAARHESYLDKPGELLTLAAQAGVPGIQGYNRLRD